MKLIIGLGNPGNIYQDTRHNIGFKVVKSLARHYKISLKKDNNIACLSGKGRICSHEVLLALPLTYMNLSGTAVGPLVKKYKINPQDLLVVCDDLDLELGRIKIRPKGSSGGHKGLGSIIEALGNDDFSRLRLGIGRTARTKADVADYVLSRFLKKEIEQQEDSVAKAMLCCEGWVDEGIINTMNIFNRK